MAATSSLRGLAAVLALGAILVACDGGPNHPTVSQSVMPPPAAANPAPAGRIDESAAVDMAQCLAGTGAGCFSGGTMHPSDGGRSALGEPGAPVLNASASGSTVTLSWTAPTSGNPVTTYVIEAGSASGLANLANFLTGNTNTSYVAPGVGNGTYYIRVRGVNASGTGAASNEVALVVGATGACAGPPRSLTVGSQSAGTLPLLWSAPATGSPTSYVIQAGSAPGLSDLANFDTGSAALSYTATNVPGGSYYVRVYSKSSCGLSTASNEALLYVVGFTGSTVQVSLSWDTATDVDLYVVDPSGEEIYYGHRTSASGGQLDHDSMCGADTHVENITWNNIAPAGTYKVRVNLYSACGVSATNYVVTVKNGSAIQTYTGRFGGTSTGGGSGAGTLVTTFLHAIGMNTPGMRTAGLPGANHSFLFRPPDLFTPTSGKK